MLVQPEHLTNADTNHNTFSFGLVELWMREWGEVLDQVAFLWYYRKSHIFGSSITLTFLVDQDPKICSKL